MRDRRDPEPPSSTRELRPSAVTTRSWPVCGLIGPRTHDPGVYGSDLGFSVSNERDPRLHILFGDTWAQPTAACQYPVSRNDDLNATLPRERPAILQPGPPRGGEEAACRSLQYSRTREDDATSWQRIRLFPNPIASSADSQLDTGGLRTPVAAFSDGERLFTIYHRHDPAYCSSGEDCPSGMACSSDPAYAGPKLGQCGSGFKLSADAAPALCRTSDDCLGPADCKPAERGVCLATKPFDLRTSQGDVAPTWYHDDARRGVAQVMYVAAAIWPERPADYAVIARFVTNRFQSLAARPVRHFDPEHPERNDYRPGYHTLLVWGRTTLAETGGAQSLPFLLYQPLAALRAEPAAMRWSPRFFAGYRDDGRPRWSEQESEAQPVYGTEATLVDAGGAKLQWAEPEFDYVNQMSVSWLAALGRWVMFYGGDVPAFVVLDPKTGGARDAVHGQWAPGAIHMRAAAHPWGRARKNGPAEEAWSSAEPVLTRQLAAGYLACGDRGERSLPGCLAKGDPHTPLELAGALTKLAATDPGKFFDVAGSCIAGEFFIAAQNALSGDPMGRLYGANIVDEWTLDVSDTVPHATGERAVELYWNASTWNPYQVVLFKTLLRAQPLAKAH